MKRLLSFFLMFLFIGSFAGCKGTSQEGGDRRSKEKIFYFGGSSEPEYLDPGLAADDISGDILNNLFEGLVDYDPKDLTPIPGVAKSWEVSPDGKTYTFHLRDNAKWSDGSPVTAHDFVYSWRRIVNPATAAKYASMLYFLKNAEGINKGTIKDLTQLGVTALDDYTFRVELSHPTPYLLSYLPFHTFRPVKKEVVEKFDRGWTRPENMVSNGYFKLSSWTPQKEIVLVPNPHYWDRQNVHLDKVVFVQTEDEETSLKQFLAGHLHLLFRVPTLKIPTLRGNEEFQEGPKLSAYYYLINTKKKPLDNKLVRQALIHAIDRTQIVKALNKGIASSSFTPDGVAGYHPPKGLEFDPEKARKLLAEAGFADPKTFPPLTISYNTHAIHKTAAEIVQNMWKQNLGINVTIANMEWKILLKVQSSRDFDVSRSGWIGEYMDPSTFLETFTATGGNNHTGWANPEYDGLLKMASETLDNKKRFEYFRKAEVIFLDEAPIIPLFTYTGEALISKKVKGIYRNLQDVYPLKGVDFVD